MLFKNWMIIALQYYISFCCSVQFSCSVVSLCSPMDWSTPGLPVRHQLLEFTQTHVFWVRDAIQPSCPLPSLSPPAFNLSQHQGLFKWVSSLHQVAKVLECQLQLPVNIQDWFPLGLTGLITFQSKGLSRVFSNTTVQKLYNNMDQLYMCPHPCEPPSQLPPPTRLGHRRALGWAACAMQRLPTSSLFYTCTCL